MAVNELLSNPTIRPSTLEKQNFDYSVLQTESRILVQQHTSEIKNLIRRTSQDVIDIGEKLIEAKKQLGHGNFINWLKFEFNWSISTATRFMRVKEQFKFVNLTNLHIAASALYLLAAPSTPQEAREEVIERASLGEVITHGSAQAIIHQHKKASKTKTPKPVTFNDASKNVECEPYTSTTSLDLAQAASAESTTAVEPSKDKLLGEKTEVATHSHTSNQDHYLTANSSDYPSDNQAQTEMQLLFKVGHHLCITTFEQQNHRWFGKVAEIKKATASDMEVLIKISLQFAGDDTKGLGLTH